MEAESMTMKPSLKALYQNNEKGCRLCPRRCNADRAIHPGICGAGSTVRISRCALHFWEEPVISGSRGSGAVFFTGCSLGCVYCQNYKISGNDVKPERFTEVNNRKLAELFLDLQSQGAANINLVTATPYVKEVIRALDAAKSEGLAIPVVYNTSGYENVETIRALRDYVDVYLPDFKYMSRARAGRYSFADNYPDTAKSAIDEMVRQKGRAIFEEDSGETLIKSGVIVRHMVMPLATKEAMEILSYLHERYGDEIWISIMSQYTPIEGNLADYPEINRRLTRREYEKVVDYAISIGIKNAYIQDMNVCRESFIPSFNGI